jgi:polar amino acid transport system permease protein
VTTPPERVGPPASPPTGAGDGVPRAASLGRFRRHSLLIASVSSVTFVVLVGLAVATAPGAGEFQRAFAAPEHVRGSFGQVWEGFLVNVRLMLVAETLVLVVALVIAVLRGLPGPAAFPLRALAVAYTDLFRGIPLLLVIFMVGLGLPALQLTVISEQSFFVYGVISLTLVYSAYVAEVYRAGIESVHGSQVAAARSLSLSYGQSLRFVVLPQAVRRVVPPLLNDFIGLQKDTALVSVLGVVEAAREAQAYSAVTFNFTGYLVAAAFFVMLTIPLARFTDWLIERDRRKRRATGG